jgi:hypothetical protein
VLDRAPVSHRREGGQQERRPVKYFTTILMVAAAEFEGGRDMTADVSDKQSTLFEQSRREDPSSSQLPTLDHEAQIVPRRCIDRPDNPGYWSRCLGEWHGAPDMLGLYYRQSAFRGNLSGLLHGIPVFWNVQRT